MPTEKVFETDSSAAPPIAAIAMVPETVPLEARIQVEYVYVAPWVGVSPVEYSKGAPETPLAASAT